MDHDRTFFLAFLVDERKVESLGKSEIALDGRQLPFATDRILEHEIEFRSVEGRFTFDACVGKGVRLCSVLERFFGLCPHLVAAEALAVRPADGETYPTSIHHIHR